MKRVVNHFHAFLYYEKNVQYSQGHCYQLKALAAKYSQLEGHSVERMYHQQRCFDGSLNKTILKPLLTAAVGHKTILKPHLAAAANTYTSEFPNVKFHVAALKRYQRKQSDIGDSNPVPASGL